MLPKNKIPGRPPYPCRSRAAGVPKGPLLLLGLFELSLARAVPNVVSACLSAPFVLPSRHPRKAGEQADQPRMNPAGAATFRNGIQPRMASARFPPTGVEPLIDTNEPNGWASARIENRLRVSSAFWQEAVRD